MGELISLASSQVPYLQSRGVLPNDFKADATAFLLDDALSRSLPFMFWGSGTMTHWEADFYAKNLPVEQMNARWWQYVRDLQGVEPPAPARRRILRSRDQDAHQRHAGVLLQLRDRHRAEVPAPRPHRAQDPQATAASL
jgi:hypothetical protein